MATGGPGPGPSESSRTCDLSLHSFIGLPWSVLADVLNQDHALRDEDKPKRNSFTHRFHTDYMGVFGFFPDKQNFVGVVCDLCHKIVNPQRVQQHVLTYHSYTKEDELPIFKQKVTPVAVSLQHYNPDVHCGVTNGEDSKPCMRSLTCSSHSLGSRRNVVGRTKHFNKLLDHHLQKHTSSKEVKANVITSALIDTEKTSEHLLRNSHTSTKHTNSKFGSVSPSTDKLVDALSETPSSTNSVISAQSAVSSPVLPQSSSSATVTVTTATSTSQSITKTVQETVRSSGIKVSSKSKCPSNFSLPLTFSLSCITDLNLLQSASASISTNSIPVTTTPSVKKSVPVISIASNPSSINHIKSCAPSIFRPDSSNAINGIRIRNLNKNRAYLNVNSVDYEQSIPRPSAVCTFNNRRNRNQILFSPKIVTYKEAFEPVTNYLNHIHGHSRPPLVNNHNITNSMNGPTIHPHSMYSNGMIKNQLFTRMPSATVPNMRPVVIGGKPIVKPMLPKCSTRAHTPYNNIQYQNGYTNGVCPSPASLAATSLKRQNPYNVINNSEDAKQSRTNTTPEFTVDIPEVDEVPNGQTDLTTLFELEFNMDPVIMRK